MKNYDDLQRFKDKTRTGGIDFKDMSAQDQSIEASNWAIIKQLSSNGDNDDSVLSNAGSIVVPAPQAVKADEFDTSHIKPVVAQPIANPAVQSSILNSLTSVIPEPKAAVLPVEREKSPATTLFEQLAPTPAASAPVQAPIIEAVKPAVAPAPLAPLPVQEPVKEAVKPAAVSTAQTFAPVTTEPVRFDKLFAAKGTTAKSHPAKDLPLQPLLEMIASCR